MLVREDHRQVRGVRCERCYEGIDRKTWIIPLERRLVDAVDELVGLEGRPAAVIKPASDGAASLGDGFIEQIDNGCPKGRLQYPDFLLVLEVSEECRPQRLRPDDRTEALRSGVVEKLGVIALQLGAADDDVKFLD